MFGKQRQKAFPVPKWEREEGPIEQCLAELNRIQRELNWYHRNRKWASPKSEVILEDQLAKVLRTFIHEMGVVPSIDQRTGYWRVFQ